jgi:EAL domain-containing protein (putative c-di-GMP-specific phosphodiesterase class I)
MRSKYAFDSEISRAAQRPRTERTGDYPSLVAVNLSPIQFNVPDLIGRIDAFTGAFGVEPRRLMFEITETAAIQNVGKASRTIQALQARGYTVAIDDFGTGYSSLGLSAALQGRPDQD